MTRLTLSILASVTASLGLAAEPAVQENQKSKFWPWEVQVGASFMGYDSKKVNGIEFSANTPRLAPSIRLSIDPIRLPFGSILFSAGYRLENDVLLEYSGRGAGSDLKHEGQFQVGALLRFEASKNLEFGVGVDARNDWMRASERYGTESKHSEWRPWLRANARYMFDKGTNVTPFVGLEGAFAVSGIDVNSSDYIRDYINNTGNTSFGPTTDPTEQSYTRGHFPVWEVALMGGVRFGRHGDSASPRPSKPKEVATEAPATRTEETRRPRADEARRRTEDEARQAEEARRRADEARQAEEARRRADEARQTEEARRRADEARQAEEARRRADETRRQAETQLVQARTQVETVILHFPTSGATETSQDRAIIRTWVTQHRNAVDPSELIITGHTDNQGTWDRNKELSIRRANRLANILRAEGINVPAANITGESFDKPVADNDTAEGRAKNRRVELRIKGVNSNSVKEGRLAGVR